jgi:hypothetical protein
MAASVSILDNNGNEFLRKFQEKQDELTEHAQSTRSGFTEKTAELIQMQQAEILRLQGVLRDNTVLPERHAVTMAVASTTNERGWVKHVLVATANDGSVWLMENFSPNGRPDCFKWGRVPLLPQVADEADVGP